MRGNFFILVKLIADRTYRPIVDKSIKSILSHENQFVYLDDKAVLSNAWAGRLFIKHGLPQAQYFASGKGFDFLVSDGKSLEYLSENKVVWRGSIKKDKVIDIIGDKISGDYWILGSKSLQVFNVGKKKLKTIFEGSGFTAFEVTNDDIIIGTDKGYLKVNKNTGRQTGKLQTLLPWPEITAVAEINNALWFGSTKGAFMLKPDGKFNYYYGERWLPGNEVKDISAGIDGSVLILTDQGTWQNHIQRNDLA